MTSTPTAAASSVSPHQFDTQGQTICPFMPVFGAPQISIVRGEGSYVWDTNDKRYLDFITGLAVVSLGHCHPAVTKAVAKQAHELFHVSSLFANPQAASAAIKIDQLLQEVTGAAGQVFFCNSGAEANEAAIKLARRNFGPQRHTVVTTYGSFHGRTLATLAATGQPDKHTPFEPLPPGFRHVQLGDFDALNTAIDTDVAAVLIEPIQGEGGVNLSPPGYLQAVRQRCDEVGALLILDEIQTGFARTGEWFGFVHHDITPDVVTMAKAIGNGMPIGACWARHDVAQVFDPGDHGSTYSGNALATAAVNAVVDEMRLIDAPRLAATKGQRLRSQLADIDTIKSVRGEGLMLGAELTEGVNARTVCNDLLQRGLLCNAIGESTLRFLPPITVSEAEIDQAVAMVADSLRASNTPPGSGTEAPR